VKPYGSKWCHSLHKGIFLQAGYEHATISQPYDEFGNFIVNGDKIVGVRRWEDYMYIGAGATSGYPFASFVSFITIYWMISTIAESL
jgi:hypothetical protein